MGYIMNRCNNCKINIANEETFCPLCHNVLKKENPVNFDMMQANKIREGMYPDVSFATKTFHVFVRMFVLRSE